jgi:hypothetical protein
MNFTPRPVVAGAVLDTVLGGPDENKLGWHAR